MRTVFFGDSLTEGMPGVSYLRFLHTKSNIINRGVGGDSVIGLPMIENSILIINSIIDEYNVVIEGLCKKYNIVYLDMKQLEVEVKGNNCGTYFFGKTNIGNVVDTLFTTIFPFSMLLSRLRGLAITIDSTHLNRHMAMELAKAVENSFSLEGSELNF